MPSRFISHQWLPVLLLATLAAAGGCRRDETSGSAQQTPATEYKSLARADFNRRAAELFLPVFWREDANGNSALEAGELAVLVGYPQADRSAWVDASGSFTAAFDQTYQQMLGTDAQW